MSARGELISQVLSTAQMLGLTGITPMILSDSGNLIIHLAPYEIVARIAIVTSEDDAELAYHMLDRELQVARHLHANDVPVVLPFGVAGPHKVGDKWATFWRYVPPTQLESLEPRHAYELVNELSLAMKSFPGVTPLLGVWNRVQQAAIRLKKIPDSRIQTLLEIFWRVDEQIRLIQPEALVPAHGDAHTRNLLRGPEGWLWMDFEDVSIMPIYWDLASFVGNLVLFAGIQEPTYQYIWNNIHNCEDQKAFQLALTARILMSTLSNLDLAHAGHGDLGFATRQLELAEHILDQIDMSMLNCGGADGRGL